MITLMQCPQPRAISGTSIFLTGSQLAQLIKGAADLHDPNPVDAEHVYQQLLENYRPQGIAWVRQLPWIGPVQIPLDRVDWDSQKSWAAYRQEARVKHFKQRIERDTSDVSPVVGIHTPGDDRLKIVDGHHRALAYKKLNRPVKAYVGFAPSDDASDPWFQAHSFQVHSGTSQANKQWEPVSFAEKTASGKIRVRVADLVKVGLEGYIHGWICVRPPCGQHQEARRESHGGKTINAETSHVIGRDLKKELSDAGYSIKYHPPGQKTGEKLAGQYATRQDAAKVAVLLHNIDLLHQHVKSSNNAYVQNALLVAGQSLRAGNHARAIAMLREGDGSARNTGAMSVANHIRQLHDALAQGPQPVNIAGNEPADQPVPTPVPVPPTPTDLATVISPPRDPPLAADQLSEVFQHAMDNASAVPVARLIMHAKRALESGNILAARTFLDGAANGAADVGDSKTAQYITHLLTAIVQYDKQHENIAAEVAQLPQPPPLDAIPDWARHAGYQNLIIPAAVSRDRETRNIIRSFINTATAHQGRFIPNLIARTTITASTQLGTGRSATVAQHQMDTRRITYSTKMLMPANQTRRAEAAKHNNDSGWWSGADHGHTHVSQTTAHEFGHGVDHKLRELLRSNPAAYWHIWDQVADALGISSPQHNVYMRDDWARANKDAISQQVSRYGATSSLELAAELWSEYTMKTQPRRPAKVFGDLVMKLLPDRLTEVQ